MEWVPPILTSARILHGRQRFARLALYCARSSGLASVARLLLALSLPRPATEQRSLSIA